MGRRISQCSAKAFHRRLGEEMPEELAPALEPVMKTIEELTVRIRHYDKQIEQLGEQRYAQTQDLRAIVGVGPITSLAHKSRSYRLMTAATPPQPDRRLATRGNFLDRIDRGDIASYNVIHEDINADDSFGR